MEEICNVDRPLKVVMSGRLRSSRVQTCELYLNQNPEKPSWTWWAETLQLSQREIFKMLHASSSFSVVVFIPPDVRTNVRSAPTGLSVPTSVTVRTGPSATTSTGPACATRASRAPAARTASAPRGCTDSSVTNTAPAKLQTHSGAALSQCTTHYEQTEFTWLCLVKGWNYPRVCTARFFRRLLCLPLLQLDSNFPCKICLTKPSCFNKSTALKGLGVSLLQPNHQNVRWNCTFLLRQVKTLDFPLL